MKTKYSLLILLLFMQIAASVQLKAQFTFGGQIVQRGEFRSGYGKLIDSFADPATFISQRTRLHGTYKFDKVEFYVGIQDVRTWGNTAQANISDGNFSVHEAWAEIHFDSTWSTKFGRQELNYDNVRFLGNLDWALQGRSHDFALVKHEHKKSKLHIGWGFNQDAEALSGNIYSVPGQYKSAQFVRYENEFKIFSFSALYWSNGKQYIVLDTNNIITEKGTRYSQTIGLSSLKLKLKNTTVSAFYYHQLGKDVKYKSLNAFDVSMQVSQLFHVNEAKKNQFRATLGAEIISGTANNYTGNDNYSFSPMYGTNHVHNGYMDLFYVGGRHESSVGLFDYYLLLKHEISPTMFLSLNAHYFTTYADYYIGTEKQNGDLGTELDFTAGYAMNKSVSFQCGYSYLVYGETLQKLQGVSNPQDIQHWAYIMIIVRPDSDKKFLGVMF